MTGIIKTDQIQGAGSSTVTIPSGTALNVTTVSGTPTFSGASTFSGDVTLPSINGGQIGGRRNIIINGAMQVAQRGTSSTSTGFQTCDRIQFLTNNTDNFAFTVSQSSTAPDGFSTSQKLDCTTAESSLDADELARFLYKVEGQDIQHFNYGSSASQEVTVSFYVRSNVTGVYTVEFRLNAAGTSTITKQYTISSANTWERKILNLPKNTVTSVDNDNSNGIEISFCVAAGSNFTTGSLGTSWATTATSSRYAGQAANIMSSTDNEWYITGIQMEVGSQATSFEHRTFGEELTLCRRYYQRYGYPFTSFRNSTTYTWVDATIWFLCLPYDADDVVGSHALPVEMRATPTATMTDAYIRLQNNGQNYNSGNTLQVNGSSTSHASLHIDTSAGLNATNVISFTFNNSNGYYDLSAEL